MHSVENRTPLLVTVTEIWCVKSHKFWNLFAKLNIFDV